MPRKGKGITESFTEGMYQCQALAFPSLAYPISFPATLHQQQDPPSPPWVTST